MALTWIGKTLCTRSLEKLSSIILASKPRVNAGIYLKKVSYNEVEFDPIVTPDPKVSAIQYAHSFTDKAGM